jgi:hypothetical protein
VSPFSPRTVLAVLAVGAASFLLFLYALGSGWSGSEESDGRAHAAANGLNGFSALAALLERQGHRVTISRDTRRLEQPGLVVITPQHFTDGKDLAETIERRRDVGPTLLILPKWLAAPVPRGQGLATRPGWVILGDTILPRWLEALDDLGGVEADIAGRDRWQGMGLAGSTPEPGQMQALGVSSQVVPLVTDENGGVLAGYVDDRGSYPVLDQAAGLRQRGLERTDVDTARRALVIVAEPDLMNNYGLSGQARAELAIRIADVAREGEDMPIVFDLTVAGLQQGRNLLTLAFEPPFLAATLCLLLAGVLVAWRSFLRFGPPVAELPEIALGKRQLVRNGAGLIERARRIHLLGPPYAALLAARIAARLGIRESHPEARDQAAAAALAARGLGADFLSRLQALRTARRPGELLRAAANLKTLERTLDP